MTRVQRTAKELKLPLLVLHGATDKCIDPRGSQARETEARTRGAHGRLYVLSARAAC
jgi:alpha-beta hydrolase superfamily lysophospholipase